MDCSLPSNDIISMLNHYHNQPDTCNIILNSSLPPVSEEDPPHFLVGPMEHMWTNYSQSAF
jgi:hypothetical protein